jgi:hypothetical protein
MLKGTGVGTGFTGCGKTRFFRSYKSFADVFFAFLIAPQRFMLPSESC